MSEIIYGRNAVRECLRARRRHVHALLLADNVEPSPILQEIQQLAQQLKVAIKPVNRKKLDDLGRGNQGVALEVGRYPLVEIEQIMAIAEKRQQPPFIVVLDHLEDPHNVGAILRTAEVVGVHGVILPKQRAADITPSVVNVSAGAAEHLAIAQVPNLVQILKKLKSGGVWVAGLEGSAKAQPFHEANLSGAIALVIGNEGLGMSRLVEETCDFLIKIPMQGQIESLNASVAGSLALYEVWRGRKFS